MGYTESQKQITGFFRGNGGEGYIPGTKVRIVTEEFHSENGYSIQIKSQPPGIFKGFFSNDRMSETNNNFYYHIFLPDNPGKGYIILLHGLNERSWDKYLLWALRMATDTGKPVVLFPIAYHMNRAPVSWIDRHAMMPALAARLLSEPGAKLASFVNVALSVRMSVTPQRFFLSGNQAVNDLSVLIKNIKEGSHPYIASDGVPDVFAYSIGAMIAQVLLLSKDTILPPESRLMLFCGGSVLNMMNGTSKMIMDSKAFDRLISYYIDEIEQIQGHGGDWFTKIIGQTSVGEAFYAMSSLKRLNNICGDAFKNYDGRLRAISLSSDSVIPSAGISDTISRDNIEIWIPEYPCSHENPFPLLTGEASDKVDSTFDRLFNEAATFFS